MYKSFYYTLSENIRTIDSNYHFVGKSIDLYFSQGLHFSPQVDDQDCAQSAAGFAALLLAEEIFPETRLLTTAAISGHYGVIQ